MRDPKIAITLEGTRDPLVMTNPSFLDFFVLEAGDYVEQLDGLLHGATSSGPDSGALQRVARALRGSATMAKLNGFAGVAAGIERVGRALHEQTLTWGPALEATLIAAVDDLKILLRNAKAWSPSDEQRAVDRTAELTALAPHASPRVSSGLSGLTFFASEATNIAAGLELLATRPDDRETAAHVLRRARALRGVAGVTGISDLSEVLDATDDASRDLEQGDRPLARANERVIRTAGAVLRVIAIELRDGRDMQPEAPERRAFAQAVDAWSDQETARERVVPIAQFFFSDGGPHIIQSATHPPTSSADRFRLELVSRGEHLRGILDAARGRPDESPERVRRQLRQSLVGIARAMASFGETELGALVDAMAARVQSAATIEMESMDRLATALTNPGDRGERVRDQLTRTTPAATAAPVAPPPRTTPFPKRMPRQTPPVGAVTAPADVFAALDAGIDAIERLELQPLALPSVRSEAELVSIDTLLYRGKSALARAREVRDEIRGAGMGAPPQALDELFDLLDLAVAE